MKDSVILGTGNSRYLKSVADFKTLYPTYDDFAAALVAGTLPIDLNGINAAGFQQIGDALGKETFLKDSTAALFGGDETTLPNDVFILLKNLVSNAQSTANGKANIVTGSYYGDGTKSKTLSFSSRPKVVIIQGLGSGAPTSAVLIVGMPSFYSSQYVAIDVSWSANSVTYSNSSSSALCLNTSGQIYGFAAIL